MMMRDYTPYPNSLVDKHLKTLSGSETKVLLVIFRKTLGWRHPITKQRKKRDWISHSQFQAGTGIKERKTLSKCISSLTENNLVITTDFAGNILSTPNQRKGKRVYYEPCFKKRTPQEHNHIQHQAHKYEQSIQQQRLQWRNNR